MNELTTAQKHEKEILGLKVSSLEQTITRQNEELKDSKTQLSNAQQQLKDMAVTIIRSQRPVSEKMEG